MHKIIETIKDKTKYYAENVNRFNNYSSNGWRLLEDKQIKVISKALDISIEETRKSNQKHLPQESSSWQK